MDPHRMGALIRRLREASGMTQSEFGERIGLRKDQVSKVEHGVRRLDIAEMTLAAQVLGTTARHLMGRPESGTLALAARLNTAATREGNAGESLDALTGRARQLLELDHLLDELGARIPPKTSEPAEEILQWARALPSAASSTRANRDGQELAERTRVLLGLGTAPIGNLADLAERHFGIDVECGPFGPGVSGMCVHSGPIALILANTALTTGHLRFTLAHELGHHLLGDPREVVIEDTLAGDTPVERRANAFAAHLLIPAGELRRIIAGRPISDEVLAELMQYFQVSLSSLVNHLATCTVIGFPQRQALLERPARRLIRHHGDPGHCDPTREGHGARPPARLLHAARAAQRHGRIGGTIVAALLGTPVHNVSSAHLTDPTPSGPDGGPGDEEHPGSDVITAFADL
jgi:transcriptional regulator with XRE-family HTH domain